MFLKMISEQCKDNFLKLAIELCRADVILVMLSGK